LDIVALGAFNLAEVNLYVVVIILIDVQLVEVFSVNIVPAKY